MTPIITRAEAGLLPPRRVTRSWDEEMLTVHYGGDSPWGAADRSSPERFAATTDHARCTTIWRCWQLYHYRPGTNAADIFYNSGFCPHGYRLEGRGPGVMTGANGTPEGNRRSYAIVYLAGGSDPVTDGAVRAMLDEEARYGRLILRDHSQWKATSCAGAPLRAWLAAGKPAPDPTEPEQEDDEMVLVQDNEGRWWLATGVLRRSITPEAMAEWSFLGVPAHSKGSKFAVLVLRDTDDVALLHRSK